MRTRLVLLGGQTIALGLMMAFLVVPASALFLTRYGAETLPYVYLAVAGSGVAVTLVMTRAQRRLPLATLAIGALATYTMAVALGWGALVWSDAVWVTFPLLVLFPLAIPVGFLLVGSQAGRLLDVRQMKAHFPRVAAGFSVGFATGGLGAAALVSLLGLQHLLVVDALAALAMLALVAATARRFPDELRAAPPPMVTRRPSDAPDEAPGPRWGLFANRMVALIFGYQVLSAAVTQLLDYLVWERASVRYPDADDLARFQGVFGGVINVTSVVFVMVLAGWFLTRFGVGFGLAANPMGVLVLLLASLVAGATVGPLGVLFFVLVCAQQVVDITLTDGTTRTSINATYQALLPELRLRAQTMIEGAGVPLALGFVGLLLIAFNALGLGVRTVVVVTLVLTVGWLATSLLAYREYGANLREVIARRAWDSVALRIDDDVSRAAVAQLLASPAPEDVHTALEAMVDAGHDVTGPVVELLRHPDPARRMVGVETAVAADRIAEPKVAEVLSLLLADPDREVRLAAAAAIARLEHVGPGRGRTSWTAALTGDDEERSAALRAAAAFPHPVFAPHLVELLSSPTASAEAWAALSAHADQLAPLVAGILGDAAVPLRTRERVVGLLGQSTTDAARDLLLHHLDDPDPAIAEAAARALVARRRTAAPHEVHLERQLRGIADRTHRCLQILRHLGEQEPDVAPLRAALLDEVDAAARRVEALLGLVHDPAAISAAVSQLAAPLERERNAAIEVIEVTVGRTWAGLTLALVDPVLDAEQRDRLLAEHAPVAERPLSAWLRDLVLDEDDFWRSSWLRACALHAVGSRSPEDAVMLASGFQDDEDPQVAATARWLLGGRDVQAPT